MGELSTIPALEKEESIVLTGIVGIVKNTNYW